MSRLVLTVIGDDRAGLVNALADVVSDHGGNWEHSQMAQLAGKFAGIVRDVSAVLSRHGLSIETIDTGSRDAPMAGGRLFEAHIEVLVPSEADPAAVRGDLEQLATELMVELTFDEP